MGSRPLSAILPPISRLTGQLRKAPWINFALLGVIALVLLTGLYLVYQTIEAERIERVQVERTSGVLVELRNVNHAALNAETGQRGYLITLDRRYLQPYRTAREDLDRALGNLRDLLDEPTKRQAQLLEEIDTFSQLKFAEMDETVALIEQGRLLDARRHVLTDEGHEAMDRLRRAVREMEAIENALLEEATVDTARAEARVLPLLGGVVAMLLVALALGYRLVTRAAAAEAEAAQAVALAEARDRADLLARELNHRVKNLFAVILAIVRMGGKEDPAAGPASERMAQRIGALLTAHEVSQGTLDKPVVSLEALVDTTLRPYRSDDMRAETGGPQVTIPAKRATPLGLVLHELTTNAVKYGCWKNGGLLEVKWAAGDGEIRLDWREHCELGTAGGEQTGFGTRLMEAAARQLRGSIERSFAPDGARVTIAFPLEIEG